MRVAGFVAGVAVWAVAATLLPTPFAARALLVVPLVLVPYWLEHRMSRSRLGVLALAAAVPLVGAYAIEPGLLSAALAIPWLLVCLVLTGPAVLHGVRALPSILRPSNADALLRDASFVLLAVGAAFAVLDRSALDLLGLDRSIVLVTAVHFHVLGFGLIAVTAELAAAGHRPSAVAAYPFLAGIPVTAAGFSVDSTLLQWIGSILVVAAGLLVVGALAQMTRRLSSWRRPGTLLAAGALLVGVPMGVLWATAIHFGLAFIDFGAMVATHGVLNTIGVVLAAFALPARST